MKTVHAGFVVSLAIAAGLTPSAHSSEPRQSQGPSGTNFHSLAQAPDGTIFAGTVSGLLRYDHSQQRWLPTSSEQSRVGRVFVSSDGVLFAQIYSGGCISVYEHLTSLDDGETWSVDPGLPDWPGIAAFAETPDGAVWAGTFDGELYRRSPNASLWTRHQHITGLAGLLDLAVTSDGNLLVLGRDIGTGETAVFLSDDGGQSWSIRLHTTARLETLSAGPSGSVVAGGRGHMHDTVTFFFSTNSGRDWSERPCRSKACDDLISVEELSVLHNRTVAAAGHAADRVSSRLIVSDLFLEEWRSAARYSLSPAALLTDRTGALWVTGMGYAWRSADNGVTFEPVSAGVVETSITSLASSGHHLFAVAGTYGMGGFLGIWSVPGTGGVHVSADDGSTWAATPIWQANSLAESPSHGVLAATDMGVLRSLDHGATWETVPITEGRPAKAAVEDLHRTLCMISGLHLRCADDFALDWHGTRELIHTDNVLAVTPDGSFLAEIFGVVHRSMDGGRSWDPTPLEEDVAQFAVSPDGAVYALVANDDRVTVSEDSGITWDVIHTPAVRTASIAFHPYWGVLVGSGATVYASHDGFETWIEIDLPSSPLAVHGDRLIGGSARDGVWLANLPSVVRQPSGRAGGGGSAGIGIESDADADAGR